MKKIYIFTLCALFFHLSNQAYAQKPVKEKDLLGNWKLIIDIEDELKEAEREVDVDDNLIEEITLKWVGGLVEGILDKIDIYMEFRPKGELKVIVEAFGERDVEYSKWSIDSKGRLFIDDTDSFSTDDDEYWMFRDDILISYDKDEYRDDERENVYMVRLD